jgi:type IV pilus assembly protein PilX
MELLTTRSPAPRPLARQRGIVLFVTLVVLVLMMLATVSVIRSADTSTVISGNFAFKQGATQASDRAITDTLNNLQTLVNGGGGNTDISDQYSSTRIATVDSLGIPTSITWSSVAGASETGGSCTDSAYCVRYFIERQCTADPNVSDPLDIKSKCDFEVRIPANPLASPPVTEQIAVRYRILIQVTGPRNTLGYYEAMVSGPVTI